MAASTVNGVHVALLRGINVGGKNRLAMRDLIALFVAAGCSEVTTYIQSGNVLFHAPARVASRVGDAVAKSIRAELDLEVPVIVRTQAELAAVAAAHPFASARAGAIEGVEPLHVLFLHDAPAARSVAALDPERSPPDRFVVRGREIYLFCPQGVARTKLTNAYFDRALATTSTGRNWRTVLKLRELTQGRAEG